METKIRVTEAVWSTLHQYHLDPTIRRERISYVFGTSIHLPDQLVIVLTDAPILLDDDCYIAQSGGHVSLDPEVQNAIFARFARSHRDVCVNVHDHHFSLGGTTFSRTDTMDEWKMEEYFRSRFEPMLRRRPDLGTPRTVVNVALVFDQSGCDARYMDGDGQFKPISRIDVIGERPVRVVPNSCQSVTRVPDQRFQRHIDFISTERQQFIAETVFAVVGCGGLGSIVGEALVRLGARRFVLVDDDRLEIHNLNRTGIARDIGRHKVVALAERLAAIAGTSDIEIKAVPRSVFDGEGEGALKSADVIVGGLDTHVARYYLNRFAIQYCVPYFDSGVSIRADESVDFQSRYVAVIPGATACMECSAYTLIDGADVERALMDDVTAASRRSAGYVDGKPEIAAAASAYALNMRATSALVMELQNWICGFRPLATCTMERWRDGHLQRSDRETHRENPDPNCPACGNLLGAADRAELPRPRAEGHVSRLLEQARSDMRVRSTRPSMEAKDGQVHSESH